MSDELILRREFPAEIEASGDGRTLEVRIVPYNTPARVADPPHFEPYDEMWVEGAFDRQLKAPNRVSVFVNVEHEQGIGGVVGRGTSLREVPGDGLHGTFRMLNHPDADKALELVKEGDLTGVSLEFEGLPGGAVREGGVLKRTKARLVNIALCRPSGSAGGIVAYKDAGVLAVRETPDPELGTVEPEAPAADPKRRGEVDELLQRVGFEPMMKRAVVRAQWDGSASRFEDDEWERACLLDRGAQFDTPKTRFAFPVLEPNGDLNVNGMHTAASRISQAQSSAQAKARAARKLVRYYRQAGEDPPPMLVAMAGRA